MEPTEPNDAPLLYMLDKDINTLSPIELQKHIAELQTTSHSAPTKASKVKKKKSQGEKVADKSGIDLDALGF